MKLCRQRVGVLLPAVVVVLASCSGSVGTQPAPLPTKASIAVRDLAPNDVATDLFCKAVARAAALVDGATAATPAELATVWKQVADEAPKVIRADAVAIAARPGIGKADLANTFEARSRLSRFFSGHCRGALGTGFSPRKVDGNRRILS